jgi:AraC-like DNA-binding protein
MQDELELLTWQTKIQNKTGVDIQTIDEDFMLFSNVNVLPEFSQPYRIDFTTVVIASKGTAHRKKGRKCCEMPAPCLITLLAGETSQNLYVSPDFEAHFICMSKSLTDSLRPEIENRLTLTLSIRENPYIPLKDKELDLLKTYFFTLKNTAEMIVPEYRKEVFRLFMKAIYYIYISKLQEMQQTPQNSVVRQFLELVERHHKTERQVGFYAERMNVTTKYLSRYLKRNTQKSANEWINAYVMLSAKTLLKSSKLSIQQIADKLNFADQSVFGKYFKRLEGVSPKEYRGK